MKLIGDLKKKVDEANTKEEAKELIANAGMELTEEEIDAVSGGVLYENPKPDPKSLKRI